MAQLVGGSEGVVRPLFRALPHQIAQPEPGTSVGLPPLWPWCAPWPRSAVQAAPFGAALHQHISRSGPCGVASALATDGGRIPDNG